MLNFLVGNDTILNHILLKRNSSLILPKSNPFGTKEDSDKYTALALELNKNIESLGFTFSKELIVGLSKYFSQCSIASLQNFQKEIVETLQAMVGTDVEYVPFYPDFPTQVVEMSEVALYLNALIHYLTGTYRPDPTASERPILKILSDQSTKLRVINLATISDYLDMIESIVYSNVSISKQDAADLVELVQNLSPETLQALFNKPIPNKENLMHFVKILLDYDISNQLPTDLLRMSVNNGVDVLRLAAVLSGKEPRLTSSTKFGNFTSKQRKLLMATLDNCKNAEEDLQKQIHLTKMLARAIHPSSYKNKYPHAYKVFETICSDSYVSTFNRRIFTTLNVTKDVAYAIDLLKQRPGEFARKLSQVLDLCNNDIERMGALSDFKEVASEVSTKVLMDMLSAFRTRGINSDRFAVKQGDLGKIMSWPETRNMLSVQVYSYACSIITEALKQRFADKEELGKVYINPNMKDFIFPTVLRNVEQQTRNYAVGSKLRFSKDAKVIRSFIYWDTIADIDLSCVAYDDKFHEIHSISFRNLRNLDIGIVHSGDITNGYNGAAEFIDINIKKALQSGIRYITMNVNLYSGGENFAVAKKCYAGIMERDADQAVKGFNDYHLEVAQNGNLYEASTVVSKVDVKSKDRCYMPYIIDLKNRCIIIAGFNPNAARFVGNAVDFQVDAISTILKYVVTIPRLSIDEVIKLHVAARNGELVDSLDEADVIFDLEQGITPYNLTELTSNWM